jgi:hypothetical protein
MPDPVVLYTNQLKKRMPEAGFLNWADERSVDDQIDDVVMGALLTKNRVISGLAVSHGTGLNVNFTSGVADIAGVVYHIDAGSVALTAASTTPERVNWVYVNNTGTVVDATAPPSGDYIPLALADTDDTTVLRIADLRPFAADQGAVENDCINGRFDIWQRGTTQTAGGYRSADRWEFTNCSVDNPHSRMEFPVDSIVPPNHPKYYSRFTVNVPGSLNIYRRTKILHPEKYAGKRVFVTFYARASIAGTSLIQALAPWASFSKNVQLTTAWKKYVVYFDVNEVPVDTIIGPTDSIGFVFYCSKSTSPQVGNFDLADVQIYASDIELPTRRRTPEEELDLCLDYFRKSYDNDVPPGTITDSGCITYEKHPFDETSNNFYDGNHELHRPMVRAPAITINSSDSGNSGNVYDVLTDTDVGVTSAGTTPKLLWDHLTTATYLGYALLRFQYTADAEI